MTACEENHPSTRKTDKMIGFYSLFINSKKYFHIIIKNIEKHFTYFLQPSCQCMIKVDFWQHQDHPWVKYWYYLQQVNLRLYLTWRNIKSSITMNIKHWEEEPRIFIPSGDRSTPPTKSSNKTFLISSWP